MPDKYEFGYNGQMKMNEIAGTGNWNTAEFWEYQTRFGHRENPDPVRNPTLSPYVVFGANPIANSDILGDVVKTDQEGANNTLQGTNGILDGKKNPISYDKENGVLSYDENVDIAGYTELQKTVLNHYKKLIGDQTVTNLKMVDLDEEFDGENGEKTTLNKQGSHGAAGFTISHHKVDASNVVSVSSTDVYIARKPVKVLGPNAIGYLEGASSQANRLQSIPEKEGYAGTTNIHEVAGHAYYNLIHPEVSGAQYNKNNKSVENLMRLVFKVYKIHGVIEFKNKDVDEHERYKE